MKQLDELKQHTNEIVLTQDEKSLMRKNILSFVKKYPLYTSSVVSPYSTFFQAVKKHGYATSLVLIFCLFGVSSVSAEVTVPGDVLYGIKTGVNEKILGWFANSPDAKAEWQLALADRRLEESETLARENKLTPDIKTTLQHEFSDHTNKALGQGVESNSSISSQDTSLQSEDNVRFGNQEGIHVSTLVRAKVMMSLQSTTTSSISKEKIATLRDEVIRAKKSVERQKKNLVHNKRFIRAKSTVLESQKLILDSEEALKSGDTDEALRLYTQAQQELDTHNSDIESHKGTEETERE